MSGPADVSGSPAPGAMPDALGPRHLIIRVIELAAVVGLVAIAINSLPGLGEVKMRLEHTEAPWVVGIALAQVGSCAGYLLVFRSTFCSQMSWGLSYDIAMAELAANVLLPAGGAGGLALGVWALRQAGMPTSHIGRRSVAFFVVTSAANFAAVAVVGLAVFAGVVPGHGSAALTLVPALLATAAMLLVGLSPRLLHSLGDRGETGRTDWRGRVGQTIRGWLTAAADGVDQAIALLRAHSFGVVVGAFSYMAFDIVALACAFAAVGHVPAFGTLVLGYLIGQLGNLIPLPGGIGGTEGALIGVFALYGVNVPEATAAVLAYRLFQLVIPALLGTPAFVTLRRKLTRSDQPARICAPLGVDVVNVPAHR